MRQALALILIAGLGCDRSEDDKPAAPRGPRPFPVETATVETRPIAFAIEAVGSVVAFEEIQVTSRVTGVVDKVRFTEGQAVKAGQTLVEIEPQRFQIAVRTAQAVLERTKATQNEAQAGLARREQATKNNPGLIPGEEVESWRTRVSTAGAEIAAARAALDRARLDLRDAYVKAPVAGVLQTRTVNTGQYVQPGTVLATLVRRDPLLLKFDVPEGEAGGLSTGMKASFVAADGEEPYTTTIKLVTTAADPVTRMVKVTAEVDDPRQATLRPGTFARVSVQLGDSQAAIAVPQAAVRPSEKGFLAYVVVDGVARERVVELGMHTPDARVQVTKGLKVGEVLVVRGAEALRDGVAVAPAGAAKAPKGAR